MKSPKIIQVRLINRTNAECSHSEVKNNRYHYHLRFEEDIGWDWLEAQVAKAARDVDMQLELYKIHPSGMRDYEVEVREVRRRKGIDDNQNSLDAFE